MTERKETTRPMLSMKERLREGLDDSRQVGFITYCIAAGEDIPPRLKTEFKRHFGGTLDQEVIRACLEKGHVLIGADQFDYMFKISALNPKNVLSAYSKIIEQDSNDIIKAKETLVSQRKSVLGKFPGLESDPLFELNWKDVFPFLRDDKALCQYSITHLRATILGFSQAAEHFGNREVAKEALDLQERFKDKDRKDPLEIAGIIKPKP
jgi:hypothetical protein